MTNSWFARLAYLVYIVAFYAEFSDVFILLISELFRISISNYQDWFKVAVIFWLQTFREECMRRMEKALEIEKDVRLVIYLFNCDRKLEFTTVDHRVHRQTHHVFVLRPAPSCKPRDRDKVTGDY